MENVSETVYEKTDKLECCDFNDLTVRLIPVKSTPVKKKQQEKRTTIYFVLNTGEQAVLKKFVKSRKAMTFDLLHTLSFAGLSLNKKTILSIFRKLHTQLGAMSKDKRTNMDMESKKSETVQLALRLAEFPLLIHRIDYLSFQTIFKTEYKDIMTDIVVISNAATSIYHSQALKQLLQIIVQAINQRLKDFADEKVLDFKDYERAGVPIRDILTFIGQNKTTMDIIAEKVLDGVLNPLSNLSIFGIEQARSVSIQEGVIQPLKNIKILFNKVRPAATALNLNITKMSEDLTVLETKVAEMSEYLTTTSQYLGEDGEYLEINSKGDNGTKFTIISIVDTFLIRWNDVCSKVKSVRKSHEVQKNRKKKDEKSIKALIKSTTSKRRKSTVVSSTDEWDSDDEQ